MRESNLLVMMVRMKFMLMQHSMMLKVIGHMSISVIQMEKQSELFNIKENSQLKENWQELMKLVIILN